MQIVRDLPALRTELGGWRRQGQRIALVPTMGNLHAGHLSLLEAATGDADRTIATIFVNPAQFVAGEDYAHYPRTEDEDCARLAETGADLVFMPSVEAMYPRGSEQHTRVTVPGLDSILCGEYRPGHFAGVATIVTKLLNMTVPDVAFFGEKDYQQLLVIRRLVSDLAIPVEIRGVPTMREADGLAMSSRNAYLTDTERALAPQLYEVLCNIADSLRAGERNYAALETAAMRELAASGWQPQYVAIRDAETLAAPGTGPLVVLGAAWLGKARLIDNVRVAVDD